MSIDRDGRFVPETRTDVAYVFRVSLLLLALAVVVGIALGVHFTPAVLSYITGAP